MFKAGLAIFAANYIISTVVEAIIGHWALNTQIGHYIRPEFLSIKDGLLVIHDSALAALDLYDHCDSPTVLENKKCFGFYF